ncbi:MAG: TIGR02186 family protein [Pseudomonadota bacterium]
MRAALAALLLALAAPAAAQAPDEGETAPAREEIVAALSHNRVSITTTYAGSEIFVFGAIKRAAAEEAPPPDVIVTISGPSEPVTVRRKDRVLGVWANTDSVVIDAAPSFYAVAATRPPEEILSETADLLHRIGLDRQVRVVGAAGQVSEPDAFRRALIRLRERQGLYVSRPLEVTVIEDILFAVSVALPADILEGDYRARVFLVREGRVTDLHESRVDVRKVGLERWLYSLSHSDPLLYGLMSLAVALAAGWLASEVFRRVRNR